MANNAVVIPKNFGTVSTKFDTAKVENDLAAGVQAGFGLIGYKGKVWSLRYRGDEQQLLRDDGDGPRNSIEVVIIKAAPYISKIWYEQGYVEGSNAAPDCFSPNGVVPDPQSTKKQANACATCPQNVWGSKMTDAGKKGKACSDSKRLAVVPVNDIPNESFGGPLLLRVPAASLQDLATFGNKMQNLGYPYYAIATRIAFDTEEAYPKFVLSAIRPLSDDEADQVIALQNSEEVKRVLAEGAELASSAEAPVTAEDVANAFEQAPTPGPTPKATQQAKPKPAATGQATKPGEPDKRPPVTAKPAAAKPATTGGFGATKPVAAAATTAAKPAAAKPVTGGFGAIKPVAAQTTAEPKPNISTGGPRTPPNIPEEEDEVQEEVTEEEVLEAAGEEAGEEVTEEASDFEQSLDEQLASLLSPE